VAQVVDQQRHAEATDLLVERQREMDRHLQGKRRPRLDRRKAESTMPPSTSGPMLRFAPIPVVA